MIRILLALVLLPVLGLRAQAPRFRYDLRDDPDLPADVRRTIDSLQAVSDSVHRCPSRADTLWAGNIRASIPHPWLKASLRLGCRLAGLPNAVRRRLRDDPASLRFYEQVLQAGSGAPEAEQATALLILRWSADPGYFPLLLGAARGQMPGLTPDGDYNAAYNAIIALAPYLSDSVEARRLVRRAAFDPSSKYAREAGMLALATANDTWSQQTLRALSLASVNEYIRGRVTRSLAHTPCPRGFVFVEWFGVEGQDYSKCELPPDYR